MPCTLGSAFYRQDCLKQAYQSTMCQKGTDLPKCHRRVIFFCIRWRLFCFIEYKRSLLRQSSYFSVSCKLRKRKLNYILRQKLVSADRVLSQHRGDMHCKQRNSGLTSLALCWIYIGTIDSSIQATVFATVGLRWTQVSKSKME